MTDLTLPGYQRLKPPDGWITWEIPLEVITPLYGGGAQARHADEQTPVRAPSIRGQLRFWWRALYGGVYGEATSLYERERALFGGLGKPEQVERSRIGVEVRDLRRSDLTKVDVTLRDPAAYALWPARATTQGGPQPPAERWAPGIGFTLVVRMTPGGDAATDRREVEGTLRAWLLFGGIGGRTRRGCGALGISDEMARTQWLPESLDPGTIRAWLSPGKAAGQGYPSLAGSRVCIGRRFRSPADAWHDSINWLRDFRQGHSARVDIADQGPYARQYPPHAQGRAGRSRWPEPDLIRRAFAAYDHVPLIEDGPYAWPRAQFGLPIQFRFQNRDRNRNFYKNRPPPPGTLNWKDGKEMHQRLASPLIVKPIQARNGRFAGVALWLKRTLPPGAIVGVRSNKAGDDLLGPAPLAQMPESPLFTPLSGKPSMEEAFMDWLQTVQRLTGGTL